MRKLLIGALVCLGSIGLSAQSCPNGVKVYVCSTCAAGSLCATSDDGVTYFDGFFTYMSPLQSSTCTSGNNPPTCLHGTDPCSGQQFRQCVKQTAQYVGTDCSSGMTTTITKISCCGYT